MAIKKEELTKIENMLKGMLDNFEAADEGFERLSSGQVDAWAGAALRLDGEIAGKDEPGTPYPVRGLYRGLFKLNRPGADSEENPYFYVIELTAPTFARPGAGEPTELCETGTLVGYGLRSTLDLTSARDGDEVLILPLKRKISASDRKKSYWTFATKIGRRPGTRAAPNALAPPTTVTGVLEP